MTSAGKNEPWAAIRVDRSNPDRPTVIRNGFFWLPAGGIEAGENCAIIGCVFMERPRWWQLRLWYRAFQWWIRK